jgi:hypothetical protein
VGPLLLSAPFFIFVWRDFDQALFSQDRRKLPKPWTPSDRGVWLSLNRFPRARVREAFAGGGPRRVAKALEDLDM